MIEKRDIEEIVQSTSWTLTRHAVRESRDEWAGVVDRFVHVLDSWLSESSGQPRDKRFAAAYRSHASGERVEWVVVLGGLDERQMPGGSGWNPTLAVWHAPGAEPPRQIFGLSARYNATVPEAVRDLQAEDWLYCWIRRLGLAELVHHPRAAWVGVRGSFVAALDASVELGHWLERGTVPGGVEGSLVSAIVRAASESKQAPSARTDSRPPALSGESWGKFLVERGNRMSPKMEIPLRRKCEAAFPFLRGLSVSYGIFLHNVILPMAAWLGAFWLPYQPGWHCWPCALMVFLGSGMAAALSSHYVLWYPIRKWQTPLFRGDKLDFCGSKDDGLRHAVAATAEKGVGALASFVSRQALAGESREPCRAGEVLALDRPPHLAVVFSLDGPLEDGTRGRHKPYPSLRVSLWDVSARWPTKLLESSAVRDVLPPRALNGHAGVVRSLRIGPYFFEHAGLERLRDAPNVSWYVSVLGDTPKALDVTEFVRGRKSSRGERGWSPSQKALTMTLESVFARRSGSGEPVGRRRQLPVALRLSLDVVLGAVPVGIAAAGKWLGYGPLWELVRLEGVTKELAQALVWLGSVGPALLAWFALHVRRRPGETTGGAS